MKFQKKAQYDYEANGITLENGYTKWYNWKKVKTPVRIIGYVFVALLFVLARVFKAELAAYGKVNVIVTSVAALLTLIVIVIPIHEILHLLVMSKGKLDGRCVITYGQGAVSALYNGYISRTQQIICLLTPCIVLAVFFAVAVAFTDELLRLYFIYLLIMSCVSSYTDIYMFFYTLRYVGRKDILFGMYKKSVEH